MLIGEVARAAAVSRDTVRYYEKVGLIESAGRRDNGYRMYGEADVTRLRMIRGLKELGFTLREIRSFVEAGPVEAATCGDVGPRVRQKLDEIDRAISELKAKRSRIRQAFRPCKTQTKGAPCAGVQSLLGAR